MIAHTNKSFVSKKWNSAEKLPILTNFAFQLDKSLCLSPSASM